MSHAQFATWRTAFDHLLTCAAGDADAATCRTGWMHDAGPLIPPEDATLANGLVDYYVSQVLRAPAARRDRDCRADGGA
jgi:hypothetical protein